jgi:hypothetical protein
MFRRHEVDDPHEAERSDAIESDPDAAERLRDWQAETLFRLGYRRSTAEGLVAVAWLNGEHADLAHRIAGLLNRGATHGQAARITLGADPIVVALLGERLDEFEHGQLASSQRAAS